MLDQLFRMIEAAASSEHAALLIALSAAAALACGWWRRELAHSNQLDRLTADHAAREYALIDRLSNSEERLVALAREAFGVLQDVSAAVTGMERTLETVERLALNSMIGRKEGPANGEAQKDA